MITLTIDFDEELGFWYFVVKEGDEIVHFRPVFQTKAEAESIGDAWIKDNLDGKLEDLS